MNDNIKNKKKIKKLIIISLSVLVILLVIYFILSFVDENIKNDKTPWLTPDDQVRFSNINYETDIFDDVIYMGKNRSVFYSEYETGELINSENINEYGPCAVFFENFFDIAVNGKYNEFGSLFTEEYLKIYIVPEKFTMQKVYDIEVNRTDEGILDSGDEYYKYEVRFKIMNNNGSFRNDMGSDEVKPLVFFLIKKDTNIFIYSINEIKFTQE